LPEVDRPMEKLYRSLHTYEIATKFQIRSTSCFRGPGTFFDHSDYQSQWVKLRLMGLTPNGSNGPNARSDADIRIANSMRPGHDGKLQPHRVNILSYRVWDLACWW